jgi:enoyl-CoA hydratase
MSDVLLCSEAGDGVLLLTMNRPDARNAISLELTEALSAALEEYQTDARWRAAVLTGAPPAFCAGLDLKSFSAPDAPRHKVTELILSLPQLGKPLIAAVGGAAMTGGLELVLSCDFAIAGPKARFADTHARIGALSGSGMGSLLPRTVGARWARQMMLTCAPVDAPTALRIGLVNELVEDDQLVPRAVELAAMMSAHDPQLVALAKGVIDEGFRTTLCEAGEIERQTLARRKASGAMQWKS